MKTDPIQGFRLSPRQRHLWPLLRKSPAYRAQTAVSLTGDLAEEALQRSLLRAMERHQILRTTYHRVPGVTFPVQVIGDAAPPPWRRIDWAEVGNDERARRLRELLQDEGERPFDLQEGPPWRAVLVRLGADRHLLLVTLSGLCADRRTLDILTEEVARFYGLCTGAAGEQEEPEEAVQYVSFAAWHGELLEDEESAEGKSYWLSQSSAADPRVTLPGERSEQPAGAFRPQSVAEEIDPATTAAADALASRHGASTADVLLAAWLVLLWRLTGSSEIAAGRVLDGRKYEDLEGALGLFAMIVPVRSALAAELSFSDVVRQVRQAGLDAEEWQEYFARDEGIADGDGAAAYSFEFSRPPAPHVAAGVTFLNRLRTVYVDRFRLALVCEHRGDAVGIELHYDAGRFDAETAGLLVDRFRAVLASALAAPQTAIEEVEVLPEAERRRLLRGFNQTRSEGPHGLCLHQLIEAQVERTPEAVAVRRGERRLSYAELNVRSNRLARHLRALGVGPEEVVAIFLPRSLETLVAVLGTLKAGGVYLPLEIGYPRERLAFLLADARPRVILTTGLLADELPAAGAARVRLDSDWREIERLDGEDLPVSALPDNLAYVLHTSGSTGRPKGVMVPHRSLVNYLVWAAQAYEMERGEGSLVHSPFVFDLTVTSLFGPLLAGRTVDLLPEGSGLDAIAAALQETDYSLLKVTPAHLERLRSEIEGSASAVKARVLVVGGEALGGESVAAFRAAVPGARLFNEYGPTETVVGCCVYEVPPGDAPPGPVPIGRPVANARLFVLDDRLRPVPAAVTGELYIGGEGVARGYLARPDLTAERFVPDPFTEQPGSRLYRSGDLVRHRLDGDLEFLGRRDHQVKIRGFRIELGEIEAVLQQNPAVREAVVVAREDTPGDRRLVAYLVVDGGSAPSVETLRAFTAAKLPDAMLPSFFVTLPALPLTVNGKVDRAALPPPGTDRPEMARAYEEPRTAVEEILAAIWAESLGLERVGVHDNFFALGGDSMRSVRIVARAKARGLEFSVQDLFRHPNIGVLAAELGARSGLRGRVEEALGTGTEGGEDGEEVARMLEELERLSEEDARALLKTGIQPPQTGE